MKLTITAVRRFEGRIVATRQDGPLGVERITYRWEGGPLARISGHLVPRGVVVGSTFLLGPYRLRVIAVNFLIDVYVVTRDGPQAWAWLLATRAGQLAELFYRRLIITAAVWGLARYCPDTVPSWRDLYAVHWARRKLRKEP